MAEKILKSSSFDLESAIGLFYMLKNEDEYKEALKTEDEFNKDKQGKILISLTKK